MPPGTEGEICHGGAGLMLGYWQALELTAEVENHLLAHPGWPP